MFLHSYLLQIKWTATFTLIGAATSRSRTAWVASNCLCSRFLSLLRERAGNSVISNWPVKAITHARWKNSAAGSAGSATPWSRRPRREGGLCESSLRILARRNTTAGSKCWRRESPMWLGLGPFCCVSWCATRVFHCSCQLFLTQTLGFHGWSNSAYDSPIPTLASIRNCGWKKKLRRAEWPLSVNLSVKRRVVSQFARTEQDSTETRRNSRS